jgi:hypothetical protein
MFMKIPERRILKVFTLEVLYQSKGKNLKLVYFSSSMFEAETIDL